MNKNDFKTLQDKDLEVKKLREKLYIILSSRSYRITAPFRWITKKINRKRTVFREWLSAHREPIRQFYFRLPLPSDLKNRAANAIDKRLGNRNIEVKGRYEIMGNTAAELLKQVKSSRSSIKVEFPQMPDPEVSIIIPVYNYVEHTIACLTSVYNNTRSLSYEVIVVDDCSDDETQHIEKTVHGLKYLKKEENTGFLKSCNRGAESASGEYLVFLNNDTIVTDGWLDELIHIFEHEPDAGIAGSQLIYPDGRLQEAGGIVWRDGAAWNYGHGDDPAKPRYNYVREVDYCSGACMAIPKELFMELGGFDTRYAPAYFEDTDISFRVKEVGKKVFYQPLSKVIHFEGTTSGTDTSYGIKSYQVKNQSIFFERWQHVLKKHRPYNTLIELEKERNVKRHALVIDKTTVTPDQDAGSLIVLNYMRIFMSMGYKITFAPSHLAYDHIYTPKLQGMGIECLYTPYIESISSHLKMDGDKYDVIFIARADVAALTIDDVNKYCPRAFVIFDTEDLHFLREMREAGLVTAGKRKDQELSIMSKADLTILTSSYEYEIIRDELPDIKIENIYPPFEVPGISKAFENRNDIAFIGSYGHPPNVDAVKYFAAEIFPHIGNRIPDICFYIIGSNPPKEILDLTSDNIIVTGHVKDPGEYLDSVRLTVAPIRFGAGIKGKIITSLGYGVPVVATSMGAEGMGLVHEEEILISDGVEQFASSVIRLYSDTELWNKLSANGLEKIRNNYSLDHARRILESHIKQNFKTL